MLDVNSLYAYLLICKDFAASSVIAEAVDSKEVAGFITGYITPQNPEALFVWQVAVAETYQRRGIALNMLDYLAVQAISRGVKWIEATVSRTNLASRNLFQSLSSKLQASLHEQELFTEKHFGGFSHECEPLIRVGPLS